MTGYVQLDLPKFDPSQSFTISGWILGGNQGGTASPLSLECIEASYPLVKIASWDREDTLKVLRRTPYAPVHETPAVVSWIKSQTQYQQGDWVHVAYIEHAGHMFLHLDGVVAASGALPTEHAAVSQVRAPSRYGAKFAEACI
jgi:hypothetical protein